MSPFRQAVAVLDGVANLGVSPKSGYRVGERYAWALNGAAGMRLAPAGTFFAGMEFEIIDTDPSTNEYGHPYRASARSYHYKFQDPDGNDLWRLHWHPDGRSRVKGPHIHRPPDMKKHWSTPRMSFEDAVRWCIESGAPVSCSSNQEALDVLAQTEAPHLLHRSWTTTT